MMGASLREDAFVGLALMNVTWLDQVQNLEALFVQQTFEVNACLAREVDLKEEITNFEFYTKLASWIVVFSVFVLLCHRCCAQNKVTCRSNPDLPDAAFGSSDERAVNDLPGF